MSAIGRRKRLAGVAPAHVLVERVRRARASSPTRASAPAAALAGALARPPRATPARPRAARSLGDDEVGHPRLRVEEVQPLAELDVDEADDLAVLLGDERERVVTREVVLEASRWRGSSGSSRTSGRPSSASRSVTRGQSSARPREPARRAFSSDLRAGPLDLDVRSAAQAWAQRSTISSSRPRSSSSIASSSSIRTWWTAASTSPANSYRCSETIENVVDACVQLARELLDLRCGRLAAGDHAEVDPDLDAGSSCRSQKTMAGARPRRRRTRPARASNARAAPSGTLAGRNERPRHAPRERGRRPPRAAPRSATPRRRPPGRGRSRYVSGSTSAIAWRKSGKSASGRSRRRGTPSGG